MLNVVTPPNFETFQSILKVKCWNFSFLSSNTTQDDRWTKEGGGGTLISVDGKPWREEQEVRPIRGSLWGRFWSIAYISESHICIQGENKQDLNCKVRRRCSIYLISCDGRTPPDRCVRHDYTSLLLYSICCRTLKLLHLSDNIWYMITIRALFLVFK